MNIDGAPGDPNHRLLAASEAEEELKFTLMTTLVCVDTNLHRALMLENLPVDAVPFELPHSQREGLESAIRCGFSHLDVFVAPDAFGGHGLFAAADLPVHTVIGEYVGLLARGCQQTSSAPDAGDAVVDPYAMRYPCACDSNLYISGRSTGSLIRFVNHAPKGSPECNTMIQPVFLDGAWHMALVAARKVKAREELCASAGLDPMTCGFSRVAPCLPLPCLLTETSPDRHPTPQCTTTGASSLRSAVLSPSASPSLEMGEEWTRRIEEEDRGGGERLEHDCIMDRIA